MPASPSDTTETRAACVPDAAAGRRFDAVVAELFPEFSRSRLSLWIKSGDLLLDGRSVRGRDPGNEQRDQDVLAGRQRVGEGVALRHHGDAQPGGLLATGLVERRIRDRPHGRLCLTPRPAVGLAVTDQVEAPFGVTHPTPFAFGWRARQSSA